MLKTLSALFLCLSAAAAIPPAFEGVDLRSGRAVRAPAAGPKGTVVVFLSSKCPCSRSHEPVLEKLASAHPDFSFVGVHSNADEKVTDARAHFEKSGLSFPVIQDDGAKLADFYGATKTPHAFVYDAAGARRFAGGVSDSHSAEAARTHFLKSALDALEKGTAPERSEARTLGCLIRR